MSVIILSYEESTAVKHWHGVPRFGHSDDVADLTGSSSEMTDYILGTIFVAGFIIASLLVWLLVQSVLLGINNCPRGRNRVERIVSPKTKLMMQYVFIVCGFTGILGTILYLTIGLPIAQDNIDNAKTLNSATHDLLVDADNILNSATTIGNSATTLRNTIQNDLASFCSDYDSANAIFGIDFKAIVDNLVTSLDQLSDFAVGDLTPVSDGIEDAISTTDDVDNFLDNTDGIFDVVLYIFIGVIVLIFVPSAVVGTQLGGVNVPKMSFVSSTVLSPLLALLLMVIAFVTAIISVMAVINADFCNGNYSPPSPSRSIISVLQQQGFTVNSFLYKATVYYFVNSCSGFDPLEFLSDYDSNLGTALTTGNSFVTAVNNVGSTQLSVGCGNDLGVAYYESIATAVVDFTNTTLTELRNIVANVIGQDGLLTCDTLLPIYQNTVNESLCVDLTETWNSIFIFTVTLTVTLMVMLSIRPFHDIGETAPSLVVDDEVEIEIKEKKLAVIGDEEDEKGVKDDHNMPSNDSEVPFLGDPEGGAKA